jgi:tellurite resistance protein TehA-like permease
MLVLLGIWRHVLRRFPLAYHPLYWGAVFPLGMYAACTQRLGETLPLPLLDPLAHAFVYVALTAWVLTFAGLVRMLARRFRAA